MDLPSKKPCETKTVAFETTRRGLSHNDRNNNKYLKGVMTENPLVSVLLTTFNQEKYIAQAIDGVLMQQVDFKYEIVIGDDCSTDSTRNILTTYATKFPDRICLFLHPHNLGPVNSPGKNNFASIFHSCRGKYVAMLEGDDYWTDPHKLQRQVDFLERNPDFSICFHNMQIMYEDNPNRDRLSNIKQKEITSIENLAYGNYIFTAACMFRKNFSEMPPWYYQAAIGDYLLHLLNAQYGNIKFIDEVMGVYRVHQGGIWGDKKWLYTREKWAEMIDIIKNEFNEDVNRILNYMLHYSYFKLAIYCLLNREVSKCKFYLMKIIEDNQNYLAKGIFTLKMLFREHIVKGQRILKIKKIGRHRHDCD